MQRRWVIAGVAVAVEAGPAGIWAWRRHRRAGTRFVNKIVNPLLLRRGLAGGGRSEIATLEHFGRKSGKRRLTLIHPERTADGIRIMAPVGEQSEWSRNVLAAGHCRVQWHGRVMEFDEPRMVTPLEITERPFAVRRVLDFLGFRYMLLHRFADAPGSLEEGAAETAYKAEAQLEPAIG